MRALALLVVFVVSTPVCMLVAAMLVAGVARLLRLETDFDDQGCSFSFGIAAILGMLAAGGLTVSAWRYLARDELALADQYAGALVAVTEPIRQALAGASGSPTADPGRGILVVDDRRVDGLSLHAAQMLALPEPCRAPVAGLPRAVILVRQHQLALSRRVGAGGGTTYKYWYELLLIDLMKRTHERLESRPTIPNPEEFPEEPYQELLVKARALTNCSP